MKCMDLINIHKHTHVYLYVHTYIYIYMYIYIYVHTYIHILIGQSCSDVYEVHGSNKLGKGSYGSVYLATERLTGDERYIYIYTKIYIYI
jgi:hypothetical protein